MLLLWRKLNKVWLQIKLKYTHITVVTMETVLQEIITMQWKSTYCNKGDMGVYGIELFFKWYFGSFDFNVWYYSII